MVYREPGPRRARRSRYSGDEGSLCRSLASPLEYLRDPSPRARALATGIRDDEWAVQRHRKGGTHADVLVLSGHPHPALELSLTDAATPLGLRVQGRTGIRKLEESVDNYHFGNGVA